MSVRTLNSLPCCFSFLVCTGSVFPKGVAPVCTSRVFLQSDAPTLEGNPPTYIGVFAVNENVSVLLKPNYLLPACSHSFPAVRPMALSKDNNTFTWAKSGSLSSGHLLLPTSPGFLHPNLTGEYHCITDGCLSDRRFRLYVVGKTYINCVSYFEELFNLRVVEIAVLIEKVCFFSPEGRNSEIAKYAAACRTDCEKIDRVHSTIY